MEFKTKDKLPRKNWERIGLIFCILCIIGLSVYIYKSDKAVRDAKAIQTKEAEIQIVKETISQKTADNLTKNTSAIQSSESDVKVVKKAVKSAKIKPVIEVSDSVIYSEDFQRWLKKGE